MFARKAAASMDDRNAGGLRKRTSANAVAAALQAAVGGIVIFVTYKFLVRQIGSDGIGAWSLVLTMSTVASLPGVGVQGAIQHFVADRAARGDPRRTADVVMTSLLAIAVLVGVGAGIAAFLIPRLIPIIIGSNASSRVVGLLPWGLSSGWLLTMCASLQFSLDGLQKATTRAWMFLCATVLYMFLAIVLTRYFGLSGLGWANVIEYTLLLIALVSGITHWFLKNGVRRASFRTNILREMLSYSANAQAIGVASVVFDPFARSLLGHFAGLSEIGLFDMASRMVVQLRTVLVGACSILVPVFSIPPALQPEEVTRRRYLEVLALVTSATFVIILALEGTSAGLSFIWLGSSSSFFILAVTLLALGWGISTLGVPAFMALMGRATLRWNVIGQYASLVVLVGVGAAIAPATGATGVLCAYVLALVVGGLLPLFHLHRTLGVTIREWLRVVDWSLASFAVIGCAAGWIAYGLMSRTTNLIAAIGMIVVCVLVVVFGFVRSRTRRTLTAALAVRVRNG